MKKVIEEALSKTGMILQVTTLVFDHNCGRGFHLLYFLEAALLHLCTFISLFYFIHFSYKIEL